MAVKIEARGLYKVYPRDKGEAVPALAGLDLQVYENEFLAIVGPSGCGKSTLLYLMAGFLDATAGELLLDGRPIRGPQRDCGIVFQHFALFPWKTVKGNILYGLEERKVPRAERERLARHYIAQMKLTGFENSYPHQLSGGMKQRVAIARTLALDPAVLLMDEPFGALDAQTRRLMQEELLALWERKKKTVVFVTHDVREAVYLADRVAVMTARPGRIKAIVDTRLSAAARRHELLESEELVAKANAVWALVREEVEKSAALGE
ncbi:MAG: nitrate ABC transporter ATP-binding protein [Candidatus Tectimicrobiota bacterium]|nr:MAG: nitrate ABC transporter ATP-binding protein [Candidatus Tectomicrobia bacterium]